MKAELSGSIGSTFDGFQALVRLYHQIKPYDDPICKVDMSDVVWFDANMCAPLGAVLYPFYQAGQQIILSGVRSDIQGILQRNGFFQNFGFDRPKKPDIYGTTIEYQRFERSDIQPFRQYVARHFAEKPMPGMSPALHTKFRESISEIFENAVDHSSSKLGIFACGQLFPLRERLDFSIADRGVGIRANIERHTELNLSPEEAIAWALEGENTTRRRQEGKPGGLGLKLIRRFVELNGGRLQIISDAGYGSFGAGPVESKMFEAPFPGTVVNIEINTADTSKYYLASEAEEVDPESIF